MLVHWHGFILHYIVSPPFFAPSAKLFTRPWNLYERRSNTADLIPFSTAFLPMRFADRERIRGLAHLVGRLRAPFSSQSSMPKRAYCPSRRQRAARRNSGCVRCTVKARPLGGAGNRARGRARRGAILFWLSFFMSFHGSMNIMLTRRLPAFLPTFLRMTSPW